MNSMQQRVFLLLQGPQSKFFVRLASMLTQQGASVIKVNVCGGDLLLWGLGAEGARSLNYHGRPCHWPAYVAGLYARYKVTDLLLYSDWRPMHQDAVLLAANFDIKVWVFEEGYLRAGFSTLEQGGVNGRSSLPDTPAAVLQQAAQLPPLAQGRKFQNSMVQKVHYAIAHHTGNVLLFPLFPFYRTHRPHNILVELTGILPRYLLRSRRRQRSVRLLEPFMHSDRKFYFYPLQLSADSQVQLYSPYIRQ